MEAAEWISVAATLGSLGAMAVAIRQANIARVSAVDARRSADAAVTQARVAEEQLRLMKEQREEERAAEELAARPSISLGIRQADHGSVIVLSNHGDRPVHINQVTYGGRSTEFHNLRDFKHFPPGVNILQPGQATSLLWGVDSRMSPILTAWKETPEQLVEITMSYGPLQEKWKGTVMCSVDAWGLISMGEAQLTKMP